MIYFEIKKVNKILYSNLVELSEEQGVKTITRMVGDIDITIVASGPDSRILSSNRHVHDAVAICVRLADSIDEIENRQGQNYTILSHNLITTHSRLLDSFESIVPEVSLAEANDHTEQIKIVKELLGKNETQSAKTFLDILKRVVDLQAQIEGFKILSGDRKPDMGEHNILKVAQNVIHPFYADLLSNNVSIKWHIDPKIAEIKKIKTDYKALNVILHHLLTNAVKYAKPYSCIDINFDDEKLELSFSMKSIRIERDELQKIFDLGYCGTDVPSAIAGEGVGMYMVKKASDLLNIRVSVEPDYSAHIEDINGVKYSPNKFTLKGFLSTSREN